ncbi:MAG TPA: hypothetical protein VG248_00670 [Caulobacteraceae bacterium]|jgi:hypothetical protein|nr:hypothetical protein [Caulobacteraceae bacterium]
MALAPPVQPRVEVEFRPAWRMADARLESDAAAFWIANGLLPPGETAEGRLPELCVVGYSAGEVSVVSTARLRHIDFLGAKLAMFRCAVAPKFRNSDLAKAITRNARDLLEAWAVQHKDEAVVGMGSVVQGSAWGERVSRAALRSTGLVFIGWTADGEPLRVSWFEEARVFRGERRIGYLLD